jgi:hypothetical protein
MKSPAEVRRKIEEMAADIYELIQWGEKNRVGVGNAASKKLDIFNLEEQEQFLEIFLTYPGCEWFKDALIEVLIVRHGRTPSRAVADYIWVRDQTARKAEEDAEMAHWIEKAKKENPE